jgi:CheY-like chemotaxis protein
MVERLIETRWGGPGGMGFLVGVMVILIVEDEALVAMDVAATLEGLGHEVCGIAAGQAEALRLGRLHHPDVALVDLALADGRTGLAITRELRERHGTVCILTTAYPREMWPEGRHGAWAWLGKPYSVEKLGKVIEYCLALAEGPAPAQALPSGLEVLTN